MKAICPFCNKIKEIEDCFKNDKSYISKCKHCDKYFEIDFTINFYESPICDNCGLDGKGFIFIDTRNGQILNHEAIKVLKSGKLSKKVVEVREKKFMKEPYIECLSCGTSWDSCFNAKGKVI